MALGTELATLRAASSSLANGVMKALQVIGFAREEVESASGKEARIRAEELEKQGVEVVKDKKDYHRGVEIEDLLEWEKVGKSLAARISRQWAIKESSGITTMLSLVERKADAEELQSVKAFL